MSLTLRGVHKLRLAMRLDLRSGPPRDSVGDSNPPFRCPANAATPLSVADPRPVVGSDYVPVSTIETRSDGLRWCLRLHCRAGTVQRQEEDCDTDQDERLDIRSIVATDWEALREIVVRFEASELAAYDHQWPTSPDEIKGVTEWFAGQEGFLAVCLGSGRLMFGYIALSQVEQADGSTVYNLGYNFHPDYNGKGHATEGCRAVLADAFSRMRANKIISGTVAANTNSCRLLARLGFDKISERTGSFRSTPDGKPIEFLAYSYELRRGA